MCVNVCRDGINSRETFLALSTHRRQLWFVVSNGEDGQTHSKAETALSVGPDA